MYTSLLFNSVILMLVNFGIACYFGRKFFRVMKNHYQLVSEIADFNSVVRESRLSLDYTTAKVSEAIREIENDISEELNITRDLTELNEKMSGVLKQFSALEEKVIELVRTNYNMESVTVSTPVDINYEVKRVLRKKKKLELEGKAQDELKNLANHECATG
ncbi:uncharacterized protein LOC130667562 [Microplitis mediator]|uniref:uncharacterized protein LOC130667562 n=1 Tax=Microplitis mediator TaxID=375433 RepID=UPI00255372B7|nr:uncharacterized protein LOC130667562 [Microplitis mediator]